jgi:hypothetical protein
MEGNKTRCSDQTQDYHKLEICFDMNDPGEKQNELKVLRSSVLTKHTNMTWRKFQPLIMQKANVKPNHKRYYIFTFPYSCSTVSSGLLIFCKRFTVQKYVHEIKYRSHCNIQVLFETFFDTLNI